MDNVNTKDLETRGFLKIPNFLSVEEIDIIEKTHYSIINSGSENKNYKVLRGPIPKSVEYKSFELLAKINQETDIRTNRLVSGADYLDNDFISFYKWHQDHESYYKWQNSYDHLNFWIPVVKPDPYYSGLEVIPLDNFRSIAPDFVDDYIIAQGAKICIKNFNPSRLKDDETGEIHDLTFDLDTIKETIIIKPGDLLLLRGDILHRSQPSATHRISLSYRAVNDNGIISKQKFFSGCLTKKIMINNNIKAFNKIISLFETHDTILIKDVLNSS
jgi:hypothetical protein